MKAWRWLVGAGAVILTGCSSGSGTAQGDAGGLPSDAGSSDAAGNDAAAPGTLGASCACEASVCTAPNPGSGCGATLTCIGPTVSQGMLHGVCSAPCTCVGTGLCDAGQCPSGFSCSDFTVNTTDVGLWCLQ